MHIATTPRHLEVPESSTEQLSLLPVPEVPVRFRLDAATRQRGLRHVAELRELIDRRRAQREQSGRPGRANRPAPSARPWSSERSPRRAA